jgi:integrase
MTRFHDEQGPIRDALWYCDQTTSPSGEPVSQRDRIAEIQHRYGPAHLVTRFITEAQPGLLYELFPDRMRLVVVLGAFVGLRLAEACGLRGADVDFLRAIVNPKVQYPARPLKTKTSKTPVPVPASLIEQCSIQVAAYGRHETLLTGQDERQLSPWAIERAMRKARNEVRGLPAGFRYHDLRHYFASLLIADGADVKTVQARLRHASAKTTLDTYGHIWPDRDESTRATVDAVLTAYRTEQRRNSATAEP